MKILIMAAGTGGHVFPGLAIAKLLEKKQVEVHWLGTPTGLENEWVSRTNIPLHSLSIKGLRGKGWKQWFVAPFRLLKACYQAARIIYRVKPDAVLGMGGFVSGPGGLMAWLLRKPLFIHEQNAVAGLTNRCLAYLSKHIFAAFPDTFINHGHVTYTGNPVREEICAQVSPLQRFSSEPHPLRVLVIGGSQGAQHLNHVIPQALAQLPSASRPEIWHQTGKLQEKLTAVLYKDLNISARVSAFIDDMTAAYGWAELVICRAGALTIAELSAAGCASILVPYPLAVDDHQTKNARFLQSANAAILIQQPEFEATRVANLLKELAYERERLLNMAIAAYSLRKVDAAGQVVDTILQTLHKMGVQRITRFLNRLAFWKKIKMKLTQIKQQVFFRRKEM